MEERKRERVLFTVWKQRKQHSDLSLKTAAVNCFVKGIWQDFVQQSCPSITFSWSMKYGECCCPFDPEVWWKFHIFTWLKGGLSAAVCRNSVKCNWTRIQVFDSFFWTRSVLNLMKYNLQTPGTVLKWNLVILDQIPYFL